MAIKSLTDFFKDKDDALSCMRLVAVVAVFVVLGTWTICCLSSRQYVPMGTGEAGIVCAAILGKAAQAWSEWRGGQ